MDTTILNKPIQQQSRSCESVQGEYLSLDRTKPDSTLRTRYLKQMRLEIELCDSKQEATAYDMGVDTSLISHWSAGRCDMPGWRLIPWTRVVGPGFLRWIARQCGYDLVKREDAVMKGVGVQELVAAFIREACAVITEPAKGGLGIAVWKKIQNIVNLIVETIENGGGCDGCE